jgi:anti-sigma regulatory factor (Ser/Thr protein kinase)
MLEMRMAIGLPTAPSVWDGRSEDTLALTLAPPASECIEAGLEIGPAIRRRAWAGRRRLVVTISARAAYRLPISRIFVAALAQRMPLSEDMNQRVRTALQEALINAIVHGNLGMGSGERNTVQAMAAWQEAVEHRLENAPGGRAAIRIAARWSATILYVEIEDSGAGFSRDAAGASHAGSGRGLPILAALTDHVSGLRGSNILEIGFWL